MDKGQVHEERRYRIRPERKGRSSPAPDPNAWFHVRIVVRANKIGVFVNDPSSPALEVQELESLNGTMVGYWVANGSDGDWKNLVINGQR